MIPDQFRQRADHSIGGSGETMGFGAKLEKMFEIL
jgi:hypothetical protein